MTDKTEKEIREQRETPIEDGDSRPDQQTENARPTSPLAADKKKGEKFTKERAADTDSLEDFKDAK